MAQLAWETVVRSHDKRDEDQRVLTLQNPAKAPLELEGSEIPITRAPDSQAQQNHSSHRDSAARGWKDRQNKPNGGGADILVRLGVQVDTVNQLLWSQADIARRPLTVQNFTNHTTQIAAHKPLGHLVDSSFHDFELTIPMIGKLPESLIGAEDHGQVYFTHLNQINSITMCEPMHMDTVCRVDLSGDNEMIVHAIVSENGSAQSDGTKPPPQEELYVGFEAEVQQQLVKADTLETVRQRHKLQSLFYEFQHIFSRDAYDCGDTDLHTVRIPTDPGALPTFVREYRIPLAAFESIKEILDSLLEKRIIREFNSTYNSPLWPVLKPSGKWCLTIDYRQLNKQVPLSHWPMIHLEQELAKVTNAKLFSTVDVANGFWTMKVDPVDQYKLAFSFGNRQFTWNRCPFDYSNSPAEFNIFLHKTMSDTTWSPCKSRTQ
ncbi:hypothetical protein SKAU_G00095540 [Synaphobranchus kaupii]|uniref:ribonuclease H n=1 Tax=Synaphobranchus kaupii TaxID=118154 RepID=A0A9Q1J6W4_SYNKA|nr:hypothetical protein SKAU_G00095540 [Synaphobranchus kaupii]